MTADLQQTYQAAGFVGRLDLGRRPALLVIDFNRGFTDPECPLGSEATPQVTRTRQLLDTARSREVLTIFTTIAFDEGSARSSAWLRKVPSLAWMYASSPWVEIDTRLGRQASEPVLVKVGASGFFGTPLASMLTAHAVDTVLVTGATTSGCVRATVVDAVQHGYNCFVVTDCVSDRAQGPHDASLFDLTAKYAQAITAQEVIGYFEQLP